MAVDRGKVIKLSNPLPPGNNNFGIYRPRYSRVHKRITYKDINFESIRQATNVKLQSQVPSFSKKIEQTQESQAKQSR